MSLQPIVHDGQVVDLSHLAPFVFTCPCEQLPQGLLIEVAFTNHCYTEGFDAGRHSTDQIVVREGKHRARVFSSIRHGLSHHLPGIVAGLPGKKVNQTPEQRNYVYAVPLEVLGQPYGVFFMIARHPGNRALKAHLLLTVESAYPLDGPLSLPKRPNAIRFNVLAYKTHMRQPIRFGAR